MLAPPKCPRCGAPVTGGADDLGFLDCASCGARLRRAPTVKLTIQSPTPTSGSAPVTAASAPPPTPFGNRDNDSTDSLLARIESVDASATLPPGTQSHRMLKAAGYAPAVAAKEPGLEDLKILLQTIQHDLAALRKDHAELAAVVARVGGPKAPTPPLPLGASASKASPRPLLIVDDDATMAEETRKACEKLGFAPQVVNAGRAALDAMGWQRPALLIIEPLLAGELSGRDLANYVKSTMEWIDIPILVHTRATISDREQARMDFGADDYVIKGQGSVQLLAKKAARLTA